MRGAAALAEAFVDRFCACDLEALERLLAPQVTVRGPLLECDGRAAYLGALRADPPSPGRARVHALLGGDREAAVFWDYVKADDTVALAQHFRARHGCIVEMRIVFDSSTVPVASLPTPRFPRSPAA